MTVVFYSVYFAMRPSIHAHVHVIKRLFVIECEEGFFGLMCKDECSPHCVNQQSCDHEGGACEGGCTDGWVGERCTEGKMHCLLLEITTHFE